MTQINIDLIPALRQSMNIELPGNISLEQVREKLAAHFNQLVQSDFEKLVSLLYCIDVSETKLRNLLRQNPGEDAGKIIAELVVERQLEKIKTRQQFSKPDNNISEEDRW